MSCLTQTQIIACVNGSTSAEAAAHLSDCADCKTKLLKLLADTQYAPDAVAELYENKKKVRASVQHSLRTVVFRKQQWFALAAGILLCVSVGIVFKQTGYFHKEKSNASQNQQSTVHSKTNVLISEYRSSANTLQKRQEQENTIELLHTGFRRIALGRRTHIVIKTDAVLHIAKSCIDTAYIELQKGMALFKVEKKMYREFWVQTPHVRVEVTGTTFSVFVDSASTKVSVLEGSVVLHHDAADDSQKRLANGSEAVVNNDSIVTSMIDSSVTRQSSATVLRQYLEHMAGSEMHDLSK